VSTHELPPMELVPSVDIDRMLQAREDIAQRLEQLRQLMGEIEQLTTAHKFGPVELGLRGRGGNWNVFATDDAMKSVDRGAWQELMHRSGLRTFMDGTARTQWDDSLERGEFPELSLDAVRGTFDKVHGDRRMMIVRGVEHLFRRLSWDHKSNSHVAFKPKFIINYMADCWGFIAHAACDDLDSLERVLHLRRGLAEPDHRQGVWHTVNDARKSEDGCMRAETPHLRIQWFKKGTGHVWFKDEADVEWLNRCMAKSSPDQIGTETWNRWGRRP